MSVFSFRSKVSSSSSLAKTTNLRSKINKYPTKPPKVRFELPHSKRVPIILQEYVKTNENRDYESLICLIKGAELLDEDILTLLKEAVECISLLNLDLRVFVEALLSVNWIERSETVISEYQSFIVNLVSAHNYHAKYVMDSLVKLFLPSPLEEEWPDGIPTDSDCLKCVNVHYLLKLLLSVVPMCKDILLVSIRKYFPFYTKSAHIHEYYLHNMLWILDYQPDLRQDILHLIFSKLVLMDVNAPRESIDSEEEDEEMFSMDDDKSVKLKAEASNIAHTLDICMNRMFNYIINECHDQSIGELDWEKTKRIYQDILTVFDKVILPTYNTHHVQFIMFLLCCFKTSITEAFLNYLWKKVINPSVPSVIRQAAVTYIASMIARASFVPINMVKGTLQQIAEWIHGYIATQDGLECVNSDVRVHTVFYSVCQALFYVVAFRHKDLVTSKKDIVFLESLNMAKMVTSRLNPLRVCQPPVVSNFAAVTRKYQLAYCYTVMEHNSRNVMPTIYQDEKGAVVQSTNILEAFYPFDPYVLKISGEKISPLYRNYQESSNDNEDMDCLEHAEDDDFLFNGELNATPKGSKKFSYGCSPGFKTKG